MRQLFAELSNVIDRNGANARNGGGRSITRTFVYHQFICWVNHCSGFIYCLSNDKENDIVRVLVVYEKQQEILDFYDIFIVY